MAACNCWSKSSHANGKVVALPRAAMRCRFIQASWSKARSPRSFCSKLKQIMVVKQGLAQTISITVTSLLARIFRPIVDHHVVAQRCGRELLVPNEILLAAAAQAAPNIEDTGFARCTALRKLCLRGNTRASLMHFPSEPHTPSQSCNSCFISCCAKTVSCATYLCINGSIPSSFSASSGDWPNTVLSFP